MSTDVCRHGQRMDDSCNLCDHELQIVSGLHECASDCPMQVFKTHMEPGPGFYDDPNAEGNG